MKLHSNIFGWEYVWEEFAEEKGGSLVKDGDKLLGISVPGGKPDCEVAFFPSGHGTQVVANCLSSGDFEFHVFVRKLIHNFEKVFGAKEIHLNDASFDGHYIIRSNHAENVHDLFADLKLRELVLLEQVDELALLPATSKVESIVDRPANHAALVLKRHVFLDKFEQLESAYTIVMSILSKLDQPVSAQEKQGHAQAPPSPSTVHRLHSPLLDR
jgi:hypothetical protein